MSLWNIHGAFKRSTADHLLATGNFGAIISIVSPHTEGRDDHLRPANIDKVPCQCLLTFDDVSNIEAAERHGYVPPNKQHVQTILDFYRKHANAVINPKETLLIHCLAGQSRSTAALLAILADILGPDREMLAVQRCYELSEVKDGHCPNELMVQYADEILGRRGMLMGALRVFNAHRKRAEAVKITQHVKKSNKYAIRRRSDHTWLHKWSKYGFDFNSATPRLMPLSACKRSLNLMIECSNEIKEILFDLEIVALDFVVKDVVFAPTEIETKEVKYKSFETRVQTVVEPVVKTFQKKVLK